MGIIAISTAVVFQAISGDVVSPPVEKVGIKPVFSQSESNIHLENIKWEVIPTAKDIPNIILVKIDPSSDNVSVESEEPEVNEEKEEEQTEEQRLVINIDAGSMDTPDDEDEDEPQTEEELE